MDTTYDKEFTCDICGDKFASATELDEHVKTHRRPASGMENENRGDIGAAGLPTSPMP
jgi:transcription elongation factor Elf1